MIAEVTTGGPDAVWAGFGVAMAMLGIGLALYVPLGARLIRRWWLHRDSVREFAAGRADLLRVVRQRVVRGRVRQRVVVRRRP